MVYNLTGSQDQDKREQFQMESLPLAMRNDNWCNFLIQKIKVIIHQRCRNGV